MFKMRQILLGCLEGWRVRRCIGFLRPYVMAYFQEEDDNER
jgi:hypothetical protein